MASRTAGIRPFYNAAVFRHREVTRLEGFSDAVFGFALTLLVVSLETPKTMTDLRELLRGLVPFAVTFAMVCWIWWEHNVFFRRYGLQDAWTAFLNCVLLFVVLFYVYPLRFLATLLLGGVDQNLGSDWRLLMVTYSSGVFAVFLVFILMHWHAWRRRVELGLDESEVLGLRFSMRAHMFSVLLAVASLVLVWALPSRPAYAGIIYCLMGPLHGWNGYKAGVAQERLLKAGKEFLSPPE